jgi:hypothetical protein
VTDPIYTECAKCGKVLVDGPMPEGGQPSSGLCPDCIRLLYPDIADEILEDTDD